MNLLDVGAKTFMDSLSRYAWGWAELKREFLACYGAKSTDAKHMLYSCVQRKYELAASYFGRVDKIVQQAELPMIMSRK